MSRKVQPHMVQGDYAAALAALAEANGDSEDVLLLLDRGLLHHYNGDFDTSNVIFQLAESRIDELYTKSLSTEAFSLVTTDLVRPYDGAEFERVMIPYYRALNYIGLDLPEDALVEARKANLDLERYTEDLDHPEYGNDAFLQYCTGLLYEWGGEWGDARVSYRRAESAYAAALNAGSPAMPRELQSDLMRAMDRLAFYDELAEARARYPDVEPVEPDSGEGEVLLQVEIGFAPFFIEERLDIPILKSDPDGKSETWTVATDAYGRRGVSYEKKEIDYILSVAFPVLRDEPPRTRRVDVQVGKAVYDLEWVSSLAVNAERNFADRQASIWTRTIARAILKYLAKEAADEAGEGLGFIVDILGSATERADIRSWRSLPHDIYMVRGPLPAGTHDLVIRARDSNGRLVEAVTLSGVEVRAGETTWVTYRLYR
jgi:hypothetical protein